METPEDKAERIREVELKLTALVAEREDAQIKCNSEHDPTARRLLGEDRDLRRCHSQTEKRSPYTEDRQLINAPSRMRG